MADSELGDREFAYNSVVPTRTCAGGPKSKPLQKHNKSY